jgi:hypothetical protein
MKCGRDTERRIRYLFMDYSRAMRQHLPRFLTLDQVPSHNNVSFFYKKKQLKHHAMLRIADFV